MDPSYNPNANFHAERQHMYPSSGASSTRYILGGPSSSTGEIQHGLQIHHAPPPGQRPGTGMGPTGESTFANLTSSLSMPNAALMMQHTDSDSTMTNMSTRSAPQPARSSSPSSSGGGGGAGNGRATGGGRRASHHQQRLDFERGYLKISAHMVDEIIKYRRMLVIIVFALLYALIAFGAIIFGSSSPGLHSASLTAIQHFDEAAWTQEMIAGWHRERPLALTDDYRTRTEGTRHLRVRECRSRAQQHQQAMHHLSSANSSSSSANGANNRTQDSVERRRRRKFEALNGCFFRREESSESMGDLCCCAGIPRYVLINQSSAGTINGSWSNSSIGSTPRPALSSSTSTRSSSLGSSNMKSAAKTATTTTPNANHTVKQRRKYLRPQVLCFVSGAANLFNAQKLIAPVANEYNLRHSFISGKGKCITCSCCHEHEPEKVNKLLANVPVYNHKPRSLMIDKNGNQLVRPASQDDPERELGFWVRMRDHLAALMQHLDDLFFWLYELLEAALLTLRYGVYPASTSHSTGLLLVQSSLARPNSFELAQVQPLIKLRPAEPPNLYIDEDLYDDFTTTTTSTTTTTTTTSTTTTTTTAAPKSTRRTGSKRRGKAGRRRRRTTSSPSSSTSTSTNLPGTSTSTSSHQRGFLMNMTTVASRAVVTSTSTSSPPGSSTTTLWPKTLTSSRAGPLANASSIRSPAPAGATTSTSSPAATTTLQPPARSSTTTKSPTVIINVYAGGNTNNNNNPSESSKSSSSTTSTSTTTTTTTTSTSLRPTFTLIGDKLAAASSGSNIELRIKLNDASNLTTSQVSTASPLSPQAPQLVLSEGDGSGAIRAAGHLSGTDRYKSVSGGPSWQPSNSMLASLARTTSPQVTSPQAAGAAANSTKSIVISLGQGNSTTIIATINTTRLDGTLPGLPVPSSPPLPAAASPALPAASATAAIPSERAPPPMSSIMTTSPANDELLATSTSSSRHKAADLEPSPVWPTRMSVSKGLSSPEAALKSQVQVAAPQLATGEGLGGGGGAVLHAQQGAIVAAPNEVAAPTAPSSTSSSASSLTATPMK